MNTSFILDSNEARNLFFRRRLNNHLRGLFDQSRDDVLAVGFGFRLKLFRGDGRLADQQILLLSKQKLLEKMRIE